MKTSEAPPLLELWLPADPKAVPQARHQAMQACSEAGLTEEDCFTLDLALGEALANAVMHGAPRVANVQEDDRHVCLSLWGYGEGLIIHVCDRGPGFRPPPPPYQMPDAAWGVTHGRGLPLMETLTDAMVVCRADAEEGGASVYLVKKATRS
jgi:anti-sigma regulatory factor (Ser/Thr protein kinase)